MMGEEEKRMKEELRKAIEEGKPDLQSAPKADRPKTDLSAEEALLEKLRAEGKLEEEE